MNFNVQLFGDNDTITSADELKVNMGFDDQDTRLATLKNPKPTITAESITAAFNLIKPSDTDTSLLVGDRNGADYSRIIEAYREQTQDRSLDLT